MQPKSKFVAAAMSVAVLLSGCTSSTPSTTPTTTPTTTATSAPPTTTASAPSSVAGDARAGTPNRGGVGTDGKAPRLFDVSLSPGKAPAQTQAGNQVVTGTELDAQRIKELTGSLPAWDDPSSLTTPFAWPPQAPPPPRTGNSVAVPFPPASNPVPPTTETGPLKVLRTQPEGDVPIAPYLAVTFNQPMVAVGTVAQVNGADSPVKLEPNIPGRWQWIGTRTLRFDADSAVVDRLPMATKFTATIPAGTKSITGGTLAEATTWTFTTPTPIVESFSLPEVSDGPVREGMPLEPIFVATFDQRIDQSAVLASIKVTAAGDVPLRLATKAEIDTDEVAKAGVANTQPGRWIAFRPVSALPKDTLFTVEIGPGTPSAEGPLKSTATRTYAGKTYSPLKLQCSPEFSPGGGFSVDFNNALDAKLSQGGKVAVTPPLPTQKIVIDTNVRVEGVSAPRTKYTVTVSGSFTDVFGQQLGADQTCVITTNENDPYLTALEPITTLDPFSSAQKLSILTTNHKELRVRVFEADPNKFGEYVAYLEEQNTPDAKLPNWKVLSDSKLSPKGDPDATVETLIDLSKELGAKPGQVIVLVESVPPFKPQDDNYYQHRPIITWVQSTAMGIDAFSDAKVMKVWGTDLRSGKPISGLTITPSAGSGASTATTGQNGLATIALPTGEGFAYISATRTADTGVGRETFILPASGALSVSTDYYRWYAFDDRQIYRPGERVRVKGWVRRVPASTDDLVIPNAKTADYVVQDGQGNEIAKGTATLGTLGGFDITVDVPVTANLGTAAIDFTLGSVSSSTHTFEVADFRRPEFEVKVEPISPAPFVSTGPITMSTKATYLAGGALPNAPVAWTVSTAETTFSPAGWDAFTFGIYRPWWEDYRYFDSRALNGSYEFDGGRSFPGSPANIKEYKGTTDANGQHSLQLDFTGKDGILPDLPVSVSVSGTVTDVNRQAWADQSSVLVHSADRYVGLRSDRSFVRQNEPINVEAIVTDVDGKVQTGSELTITAGLLRYNYGSGTAQEEIVDPQTCKVTSAKDASKCAFKTPVGGQYQISTTVTDAKGGRNRTSLSVWVTGATDQTVRTVDQEKLTVVPDKAEYANGDTAKILVQAPFAKGEGLLVVSKNGMREPQRFTLKDGSAVLEVPIVEADVPGVSLTIEVAGTSTRVAIDGTTPKGAPERPAYAVGTLTLPVPPKNRTLNVTATPAATELQPGEETSIGVTVNDAAGAPVQGAEFAVVVVDEAVLGLTNYQLGNPIDSFYGLGGDWLSTVFARASVRLDDPTTLAKPASPEPPAPGGSDATGAAETVPAGAAPALAEDSAFGAKKQTVSRFDKGRVGAASNPVTVRSNFDALALFEATTLTDATGKASVKVKVPDNLTRYRVMVVAASGADRFGKAESNITARLPLAVRPSPPRFLNTGDQFELPVVVQNNGKSPGDFDVIVQSANLDTTGPAGRKVTVAAGDRVEVRFPMKVKSAGTARIRVSAFGPSGNDSAEQSIPVYTPGTAEAFATYGVIDGDPVKQPVLAPKDVFSSYGGLEISTSSTSLQSLTDAVLYISDYSYQSSDGYASRIMSIGALRKVLKDFATEGLPSEKELNDAVDRDVAGLIALQNPDGGFPYWRRGDETAPYISVQATHALILARDAGFAVSPVAIERALQYLGNTEALLANSKYSERESDSTKAYSLWVRALAGQRDPAQAAALLAKRGDKLTLDALAWLWGSLDNPADKATVEKTINNRAVDTAGAVTFTSGYSDKEYLILGSDRRTDAIVLDSLIANAPKSDLIPKIVTGLLADRTKGRWDNAQENTFALLAFKRYYDTFEASTPNFVARAWLGDKFAGEHTFAGRTTERANINVPMQDVVNGGNRDLVLAKDGTGRMYYRVGLRYVPTDLKLDALDRGFVVTRTYEAVDNKDDVKRDADGTWRIKAGAKVLIKLTMVAESQRTFVALVDPLPAGFEGLNPSLAVTPPTIIKPGQVDITPKFWWWNWYSYTQFRDDRSEAFTTYLPGGVYDYSYIARATTPGSFVVPPTRAEEMYAPETFGRAATDKVVIG